MGLDAGAGGLGEGNAEGWIFDEAVEGLGQGFRIGGRDEEAGFAFGNLVGGASKVGAEDREAEAHGFEDDTAEGFGVRFKNDLIGIKVLISSTSRFSQRLLEREWKATNR